jgi:hypothetical protein
MCQNNKEVETKICNICDQPVPNHTFLAHLRACAKRHAELFGEPTFGPGPHDYEELSPEAQKILSAYNHPSSQAKNFA